MEKASPEIPKCSRAGCVERAIALIDWRNPRVHSLDRIKSWSACAEHQEFLVDYLKTRDFLIGTRNL